MIDAVATFSGFIGALIGFAAAWFVARWSKCLDARGKLRLLLLAKGHEIWHEMNQKPFHEIFGRNHVDIQAAYFDLRCLTLFPMRKRLDRAWHNYTGQKYYESIPEEEPSKLFAPSVANSREEAIARVRDFLNALL
jgi:hypothetical protein